MSVEKRKKCIAILGGGPSGLFIYKNLVQSGKKDLEIHIFEAKKQLGAGMPYSADGANMEHITNVSDNEIPEIVTSIEEWIETVPEKTLTRFNIEKKRFNEYKVLPRLLFGQYLAAQFELLLKKAKTKGLTTKLHLGTQVIDIIDSEKTGKATVKTAENKDHEFDHVIICTGHKWPVKHEGNIPGFFDSPYPPAKLAIKANHAVAIKGSSLTAIDAIRTLARNNGTFEKENNGRLAYKPFKESPNFSLMMHSRSGLLPAIRFHLEEPQVSSDSLLTPEEIKQNRDENDGFLSLDFVFERDFKQQFREKDPDFFERIKDMSMETFVETMMDLRERKEPFRLFKDEYVEAEKSIRNRESIHWKEVLAVLSFAMNYPAKYLSAEDMLRLQKVLMPLISIVIAFVPQSSCEELLALHDAGKLEIVSVGADSEVKADKRGGATYHYTDENDQKKSEYYQTFVDCVGQPHLSFEDFPFKSLVDDKAISPARLKFRSTKEGKKAMAEKTMHVEKGTSESYYLNVPGITINDNFQIVDPAGKDNSRIYIMAVPYIGGYNPDYSGLDFCEEASDKIVGKILGKPS